MRATLEANRSASMRRMAMLSLGSFIALLMAGTIALWLAVGSTVFFEVLAAGIAYCF